MEPKNWNIEKMMSWFNVEDATVQMKAIYIYKYKIKYKIEDREQQGKKKKRQKRG